MTGPKNQAARRIADNNHAAKRRAVNGATKRATRLTLSNALNKVKSLERQVEHAVARADNCEAKFIMQNKSRFTALKETRQVINAHKRSVKRSVHNKMTMSANAALHKVTAKKMEIEERNKRLQKALAYQEKIYDHM